MVPGIPNPPPPDRLTDTCKSITFRNYLPHPLYLYVCLYLRSLAYPSAHPQVSTLTHCTSMYVCTYVPWHTPQHTHRSPPSPTVPLCMSVLTFPWCTPQHTHTSPPSPTLPLCMSVLTFLGVPLSTPTGLHPHPLYLYVYLYLRSLAYPSAHPHVSTLTHCTSMYVCTHVPWHTLSTPTGLHPHPLYLYVYLYLRSLAYPSAHPQVSTLTHCTSMYVCTYVPWHTPQHRSPPSPTVPLCISVLTFLGVPFRTPTGLHPHPLYLYVYLYSRSLAYPQHTHTFPPSPTVPLCMSVLTFLGVPFRTPTGLNPHQLYLYRLNGCFTVFNHQLQGKQ